MKILSCINMESNVLKIFESVADFRMAGKCHHKLSDILFIALCTFLSNGEDFADMVLFGKEREKWLRTILELPNGIPSHDTFNRIFQTIDTESLSKCLEEDGSIFLDYVKEHLISFDGKKIRGVSPKTRGNKGLFILSAWVSDYRICVGQTKVEDKSNEITAIPKVLDNLDERLLKDSIISIDAIGCQTEIASNIRSKEAHYLLAVKKNQKNLYTEIEESFASFEAESTNEEWEYDRGRYEKRICQILPAKEILGPRELKRWQDLTTIIKIQSFRKIKNIESSETRYYIGSSVKDSVTYNQMVRGHWGIENHLHWHLDVTFQEDKCRARTGNAPANLNVIRKLALRRIANKKDRLSLKKRRYKASMNLDYLYDVLIH